MKNRQQLPLATTTSEEALEHYLEQPFPTSDLILLCSFGLDPAAERTAKQLHRELLTGGFSARMTRHLIRASPLLRRSSRSCYRLREF